jgi:hypothetical protein
MVMIEQPKDQFTCEFETSVIYYKHKYGKSTYQWQVSSMGQIGTLSSTIQLIQEQQNVNG